MNTCNFRQVKHDTLSTFHGLKLLILFILIWSDYVIWIWCSCGLLILRSLTSILFILVCIIILQWCIIPLYLLYEHFSSSSIMLTIIAQCSNLFLYMSFINFNQILVINETFSSNKSHFTNCFCLFLQNYIT